MKDASLFNALCSHLLATVVVVVVVVDLTWRQQLLLFVLTSISYCSFLKYNALFLCLSHECLVRNWYPKILCYDEFNSYKIILCFSKEREQIKASALALPPVLFHPRWRRVWCDTPRLSSQIKYADNALHGMSACTSMSLLLFFDISFHVVIRCTVRILIVWVCRGHNKTHKNGVMLERRIKQGLCM